MTVEGPMSRVILGQHFEPGIADGEAPPSPAAETLPQVPGWFLDAASRVGQDFVARRARLVEVGWQLADHLQPSAAAEVRESVAGLKSLGFRVAVLGQAKAGKSSFLNALVGLPDMLPTGIEPCTKSVTWLHFNHPIETAPSATFRFFSTEEWRQLAAEGDPHSLTPDKLGREFAPDGHPFDRTEARAPPRPQRELCELLGGHHTYAWISPSLIASYVDAGQCRLSGGSGGQPSRESYADVTRSASIYVAEGAFVCPLTLIDTPGVHDYFPGAAEFVLGSIKDADMYVIVLSAPQGLSKADTGLLRMVHGLRKDRIVVFINRLDELDDAIRQGPRLIEEVRALLQSEFDVKIPVLAGSAKWANAALRAGRRAEDSLEAARATSRAKALGVATTYKLEDLALCPPEERIVKLGPLLHAASGFPQLYRRLEELFRQSKPAEQLHQFAATFAAIAHQAEAATLNELLALQENVKTAHRSAMADTWELHRLKGEVESLDDVISRIDRISCNRRIALERRQNDMLKHLRQELYDTVKDYVSRERTAIVFALDQNLHKTPMRIDVSGIRQLLEQTFLAGYRKLHQGMVEAEATAARHLQRVIDEALPHTPCETSSGAVSGSFVYPRLSALSRIGPFDIDPRLWSRWRRAHPSIRETVAEFEGILTTEFLAIAGELVAVAEREIGACAEAFAQRLLLARSKAVQTVMKRKQELHSKLDYLQHALEPQVMEQFLAEQLRRLSECRERLLTFMRLARWLDNFLGRKPVADGQAPDTAEPSIRLPP
jgi:septum formation topological specificity factor MinE